VLGRALAWQSIAPAVPAVLLAATVGTLLTRALRTEVSQGGGRYQEVCDAARHLCMDPATRADHTRWVPEPRFTRAIAVPFDDLALWSAGALAAVLVTVGVGVILLRGSTTVEELRI